MLALDANNLPARYNNDIILQLFKLVEEHGKAHQGVDILSFVFYDFMLRIFYNPNANVKYMQNKLEFVNSVQNYLFPFSIIIEIESLQSSNLTAASYQMYAYNNISQFHQESDHFVKFLEKKVVKKNTNTKNEKRLKLKGAQATNNNASHLLPNLDLIFNIIDTDSDGYINFYDFGHFVQISYLFGKFDEFNRGYVLAGDLYEKYTQYSEYPSVGVLTRDRAKKFHLLNQDIFVDLLRSILMIKIEDIVGTMVRKSDPTTLFEYELKTLFKKVNLAAVPDTLLQKCVRGLDDNNVPKYEWECAFIQAMTATANYYDWSVGYKTVKSQNLTLTNTVFVNVDPALGRR